MPQISSQRYMKKGYITLERSISYYYQLHETMQLVDPGASVFEIGIGSGLVSAQLRQLGYHVTTCDFDETVQPDVVADVRQLPVADSSHDVVMACQILEHLPWDQFGIALTELARVSKRYAIISLPRRHTGFEWIIKVPGMHTLFKRGFLDVFLPIPLKFPGFAESGQHYWEIDQWVTSQAMVRRELEKVFHVRKTFSPPLNKYHIFFVLEKKVIEYD